MENNEFSPLLKSNKVTKNKKKFFIFGAVFALFIVAGFAYYLIQNSLNDEPPSLVMETSLQGFSYDESGLYLEVDDDYIDDMEDYEDENDDLPDDEQEELEDFDAGVNYVYFNEEYSFEDVLNRIKADEGTKLLLCRWDGEDQEFQCYPKGPYSGTKLIKKSKIDEKTGAAGEMWAVISSEDVEIWGANPPSGIVANNGVDWDELDEGWHIDAYSESFLEDMVDYCGDDRIKRLWVQKKDNSFEKLDLDEDVDMNSGYNLVWYEIEDDKGDCSGDFPTDTDTENPTDISALVVTPNVGKITLTWPAATDNDAVTAYVLYYGTKSVQASTATATNYDWSNTIALTNADLTVDANTGNLTYVVSKTGETNPVALAGDTDYYFAVKAKDATGNTSAEYSEEVSAKVLAGPGKVAGLSATGITDAIELSWTPVVDAAASYDYIVYYGTSSGTYTWSKPVDISAASTDLTIDPDGTITYLIDKTGETNTPALTADTKYYFVVKAKDAAGNLSAENSSEVNATPVAASTAPSAPVQLTAGVATYNSVALSWDTVIEADSYNVYYSDDSGVNYKVANTAILTATSYTVNDLNSNTAYFFVVSSVKDGLEGNYSTSVTKNTEVYPIGNVGDVTVKVDDSNGNVAFSFIGIANANSYDVYYSLTSLDDAKAKTNADDKITEAGQVGVTLTKILDIGTIKKKYSDWAEGDTIYFAVKAVDSDSDGVESLGFGTGSDTWDVSAVAPTVKSKTPTQEATNVSVSDDITVNFNQSGLSLSDSPSVTLTKDTNTNETITSTFNENIDTLTIDPKINLEYNTNYTVTIPTDTVMNGIVGNEEIKWSFTTEKKVLSVPDNLDAEFNSEKDLINLKWDKPRDCDDSCKFNIRYWVNNEKNTISTITNITNSTNSTNITNPEPGTYHVEIQTTSSKYINSEFVPFDKNGIMVPITLTKSSPDDKDVNVNTNQIVLDINLDDFDIDENVNGLSLMDDANKKIEISSIKQGGKQITVEFESKNKLEYNTTYTLKIPEKFVVGKDTYNKETLIEFTTEGLPKLDDVTIDHVSTTNDSATIKWSKVEDADSYNVKAVKIGENDTCDGGSFSCRIGDTCNTIYTKNTIELKDSFKDLSPSTNYCFAVQAKNDEGQYSDWAYKSEDTEVEVVKLETPVFTVQNKIKNTVIFNWNSVSNANSYNVEYVKSSETCNSRILGFQKETTTDNFYKITSDDSNLNYCIRVKATADGYSDSDWAYNSSVSTEK